MRYCLPGFLLCAAAASSASAADFRPWTSFANAEFKGTKLFRDAASGAYCYVTAHSRVDADGAPNAYHPGDLVRRHPPYLGLDSPANAGWPRHRDWWPSVLVPDPTDPSRPYVQPSGPFEGYFVAQTSLRVRGGNPLHPSTYVDARSVPYIVLPGSVFPGIAGTGAPGDVGIAWNLSNGKKTPFVIGDTGGGSDARLGEGSIALFKALGGTNPNARNGTGVAPGTVRFIVFRSSRHRLGWPASQTDMATLASELLDSVGGVAALSVCSD
jgi:Fungal chitosanase of glycosyl hydrolase group 75